MARNNQLRYLRQTEGDIDLNRAAVIVPPVITPSEVPAGAFMLASGLMARGVEAPIHDLSLGFFLWLFGSHGHQTGYPNCSPALEYLRNPEEGFYTPHKHRSCCGVLQSALKKYAGDFPGWKLSLMDSAPPGMVHSTNGLCKLAEEGRTPFSEYLHHWFRKQGDTFQRALVSLSYISQLPAAVEVAHLLKSNGKRVTVGGSLPAALKQTGRGIELLEGCFDELLTDDGRSLVNENGPLMSKLEWPVFAMEQKYLSSSQFIPFPLTTGCIWNRCLFCPDRDKPYTDIPGKNLENLLQRTSGDSIVHLIDSAIPPSGLRSILPLLKEMSSGFYGFARPEAALLEPGLLRDYRDAGCIMLQTGVESGSEEILRRFAKGFLPGTAEKVVKASHGEGILNYVYLLFGLPGETEFDRNSTLDLVKRVDREIDYMNISVFNLPEKSELTERAEEFGIQSGEYDPSSSVLRFYRPFRMINGSDPRTEARNYLNNVFRKEPSVERILMQTPKWFRAGHMALMKPSD